MYLLEYIDEIMEMLDKRQIDYYRLTGTKRQVNLKLRRLSNKEAINLNIFNNSDNCRIFEGGKYVLIEQNGNALDLTIGLTQNDTEGFVLDFDKDYDWASFLDSCMPKNSSIFIEELKVLGCITLEDYFNIENYSRHYTFGGDTIFNSIEINEFKNKSGCYIGMFDSVHAKDRIVIRDFDNPENLDYMFSYVKAESILLKGDTINYGAISSPVKSCKCMFKEAEIGTLILDFAVPMVFESLHDMFLDSKITKIMIRGKDRYNNLRYFIKNLPMNYFGGEIAMLDD